MFVSLNGDKIEVKDDCQLTDALGDRCFANRSGIAVALNNTVIPKAQWDSTALAPNDRILIIAATKGG